MIPKIVSMSDTSLTGTEIAIAVNVLQSGNLRQGQYVASFEKKFADFAGASHAVASSSGTSALHLAYLTFIKPGDEVLVPSFTFIATASTVILAGGKPVFCDIDPDTLTLDLDDAESRVTGKTRAVAPVHLFGNACNISRVQEFAARHGLKIVWDAAQAHGTKYAGGDVGRLEDFVCYSFYPTKNLFVGEGGMTLTGDGQAAELMKLYRSHGQAQKYRHTLIGYNYRMTDVEAAIGLKQMARLPDMLAARRNNASRITRAVSSIKGLKPQQIEPDSDHSYHQYCLMVDPKSGINRDIFRERLHEAGIATGIHYPLGLHEQPVFKELYGEASLPVTESVCSKIVAIPVHHGLSEGDVDYIVYIIKKALGQ